MIFNDGMTIWILAIVLLGSASLAGWRQGASRVAFSFIGILVAALLAVPVGHVLRPLLMHLGADNPVLAWAIAVPILTSPDTIAWLTAHGIPSIASTLPAGVVISATATSPIFSRAASMAA